MAEWRFLFDYTDGDFQRLFDEKLRKLKDLVLEHEGPEGLEHDAKEGLDPSFYVSAKEETRQRWKAPYPAVWPWRRR